MEGIRKGKTRSGLYYEGLRILEAKRPEYSVIENVKNLTSKRFKSQFDSILKDLTNLGYKNYWKILNSKDYGIPQNRERLFIISIRSDIVENNFSFPQKVPLKLKLKDMLKENVEEKYYLSKKAIGKLIRHNNKLLLDKQPYILVNEGTKMGYVKATDGDSINVAYPNNITKRGRVGKEIANTILTSPNMSVLESAKSMYNPYNNKVITDMAPTQTTTCGCNTSSSTVLISENGENLMRIRKLTPLECWRLMGFSDIDFYNAKNVGISDTQLYRQAGNSIVVNILEYIFQKLLIYDYKK